MGKQAHAPAADFDWRQLSPGELSPGPGRRFAGRVWFQWSLLAVLLALCLLRMAAIVVFDGTAYRQAAARPIERTQIVPSARGRILARDGTVLACDRPSAALLVHYRYLEQPPNRAWLQQQVSARLPKEHRRDAGRRAAAEAEFVRELDDLHGRLARLCGVTPRSWQARRRRVQVRVEAIAADVQDRWARRRQAAADQRAREEPAGKGTAGAVWARIRRAITEALADDGAPTRLVVAEELDYHLVAENLTLDAVAEVEGHPQRYPGVKIVSHAQRDYPQGSLAAHVLGYLGAAAAEGKGSEQAVASPAAAGGGAWESRVGITGIELRQELALRGRHGQRLERLERSGRVIGADWKVEPKAGRDVVLTLDAGWQKTAEELLDAALRSAGTGGGPRPAGGAIVVLDVHTGAVRVCATAPRFDPRDFAQRRDDQVRYWLGAPGQPLFDRATRMAIPPGSLFKVVTAAALCAEPSFSPQQACLCRGYWRDPDHFRCAVYATEGRGHGQVDLSDALATSCNVFFFEAAAQLGPGPLELWARRFGLGERTGIDLPYESAGHVPAPLVSSAARRRWTVEDTLALAIGQSALRVTPLQMARLMAAIGNGGYLVRPHVVQRVGLVHIAGDGPDSASSPGEESSGRQPIPALRPETLSLLRGSLERVVSDESGTAFASVHRKGMAIAGKTGTAETGRQLPPHAWFAGYIPADEPQLAFAVVLEHGGSGATAAGPVARALIQALLEQDGLR
jgi:penicillin-binding protein 2